MLRSTNTPTSSNVVPEDAGQVNYGVLFSELKTKHDATLGCTEIPLNPFKSA